MAYKISKVTERLVQHYDKRGKQNVLTPPEYNPPLQKPTEVLVILLFISSVPLGYVYGWLAAGLAVFAGLALFGVRDLFIQDDHTIMRIYGPLGRLRYIFEDVFRDKYLQYFNETNTDGRPIPKIVRDYIYQKAKGIKALTSFGTELDIYDSENTAQARILHSNFASHSETASYGFDVGGHRQNIRPFRVKNSMNISAMSYGALNYKAAECLSLGARGVGYVNTGEGGCGPHAIAGNDTVLQLGTGKFGAGKDVVLPSGKHSRALDEGLLKSTLEEFPNIGMIQLKISQGAKPGIGGHLPGSKVTPDIAAVRKVEVGKTLISPPQHVELMASTSKEGVQKLMDFCKHIRSISALPVGIKLCIGKLSEIDLLVEAMKVTGEGPDMIQVDGADGGTGAGPNMFVNYVGYGSAVETIAYLHKKLVEAQIRDHVHISASGRLLTPAHAAYAFAFGADTVETARAAMLAIGCIQALKCHTNHCPTGITTNQPWRMHGIDIPEKSTRIHKYLSGFHSDMLEFTKLLGHDDPRDIKPNDLRIVTNKKWFNSHFEEDPFGLKVPSPTSDSWIK